jgi:hypothetical protein
MFEDKFGYHKDIPEEIREIFMWLCQDLASLQMTWCFYKGLFGSKVDSELLANYASSSFIIIEESLRISMVMTICRFNDPSMQQNNQNLSFELLVQMCGQISGLDDVYKEFNKACAPFVVYRNKRFGHRDLPTALDYEGAILPGIGKKEVEEVIDLATQLLNSVALHFTDEEFYFDGPTIGGAENLLGWFKKGLKSHNILDS